MSLISRDEFLKPLEVAKEKVDLPEFGEGKHCIVWGFNAKERTDFELSLQNRKGKLNLQQVRERLIVASVRDEQGNPLFTQDDVAAIGNQSSTVVQRIFDVAMRLSGFSDSDVESLAKN